jgi:hypothetical protein
MSPILTAATDISLVVSAILIAAWCSHVVVRALARSGGWYYQSDRYGGSARHKTSDQYQAIAFAFVMCSAGFAWVPTQHLAITVGTRQAALVTLMAGPVSALVTYLLVRWGPKVIQGFVGFWKFSLETVSERIARIENHQHH